MVFLFNANSNAITTDGQMNTNFDDDAQCEPSLADGMTL